VAEIEIDCAGTWGGSASDTDNDGICDWNDGDSYETVQIGTQLWMKENLKVTHYNDGTAIPTGHSNWEWGNLSTDAYAIYDDNTSNAEIYGNLYNWYAVDDSMGICPEGWHVPSYEEWGILTDYLGGAAGGKMKEAGTEHWNSPNTGATNESGFTGLPAGYRSNGDGVIIEGDYGYMGSLGYFWSSTETNSYDVWHLTLNYNNSNVAQYSYLLNRRIGFSVRCLGD